MFNVWLLLGLTFILCIGFIIQNWFHWSPLLNLLFSFILVLLLPPLWSFGLIGGSWISCAFFSAEASKGGRLDAPSSIPLINVLLYSVWTFSGFILTLVYLWHLKIGLTSLQPLQREMIAWFFLILIEVCQYKVIAQVTPVSSQIPLGYWIAVLNFIMLIYWILPLGIAENILVLLTLLMVSPLLLSTSGRQIKFTETISGRR